MGKIIRKNIGSGLIWSQFNGVEVTESRDNSLANLSEINIKFLNGEVTIPAGYGAYCIATGCGSGKTSAIKQIILNDYNKGVLYAASTINECNEMYQFLKNEGVSEDDMIVLHSNYMDEGVDLKALKFSPGKLADKKIIICTHHKLLNEYPEILLNYNRNILSKSSLSLIARAKYSWDINGQKKFPRQLVIVDELPTCYGFNFNVNKQVLNVLGVADTEYKTKIGPNGEVITYLTAKLPIRYTNGGDYQIAESLMENSGLQLFNGDSESSKLKNGLALSIIYDNYQYLDQALEMMKNRGDKNPTINVSYTIADQIYSGGRGETTYLLFDGTGDITFRNSRIFNLLTYQGKYNSPVNLCPMNIGFKRSYRTRPEFEEKLDSIRKDLDLRANQISDIINRDIMKGIFHKALIVTWRDFKVKGEGRNIPKYNDYDTREISIKDYLSAKIKECSNAYTNSLGIPVELLNNFSIIHYQSGLDKATNEFRDYDTIIFLGEFHVPDQVVGKFNQDYRTNASPEDYLLYQLVQAVCRTRIRNHNSEPIDVYFTEDWGYDTISKLRDYLVSNNLAPQVSDMTLFNVHPKWRNVAKLLGNLSEEFRECIEREDKYCTLRFTLDDIYNLIPIGRRKVGDYNPMINYFKKKHGIEIIIESVRRGRNSVMP